MTRLILALILLATPAFAQQAQPIAFTSYPTNEAFLTAMRERFPTGSSFKTLRQTMALSGASRSVNLATPNAVYIYRQPVGMVSANQWTITVATKDDIIRSISTHFDVINTQPK